MRPKCNQENTLNEVKRWCEKSPYIRFSFRVSFLVILNRLSFSEDKELISIKLLTNIDILVGEKESLDVRNMLGSDSHHFCISFYNGHYLCGRCKLSRSHREWWRLRWCVDTKVAALRKFREGSFPFGPLCISSVFRRGAIFNKKQQFYFAKSTHSVIGTKVFWLLNFSMWEPIHIHIVHAHLQACTHT